jgi:hypothetical protein
LGRYKARSIAVDTDPDIINLIKKKSELIELYDSENMIYGREDASCIYARGKYTIGADSYLCFQERIRKMTE